MNGTSTGNFPQVPPPGKNKFYMKNKVWIEPDMFQSNAFYSLSASAIRTLMRCLQKRKWVDMKVGRKKKKVYTNDGFIFPYNEADYLEVKTTQFYNNMKELIEKGFLDLVYQGGSYQKKEKDYSVYKLSERWRQYDAPDFKKVEKPKSQKPDFYIQKNIERKKTKATSQKRSEQLHKSEVDIVKRDNYRLHESEVDERLQRMNRRLDSVI